MRIRDLAIRTPKPQVLGTVADLLAGLLNLLPTKLPSTSPPFQVMAPLVAPSKSRGGVGRSALTHHHAPWSLPPQTQLGEVKLRLSESSIILPLNLSMGCLS